MEDEKYIECTWQEYEGIIRNMICSDFKWLIKLEDNPMNRKIIMDIIREDIELNRGDFPDRNTFIEKIQEKTNYECE